MTVTGERFAQGMTVDEYTAQMTKNREVFETNERAATIRPEDVAFFAALPETLNVLVITEDWCADALANVPVLVRLGQESGKLNLRLFLRDQNLDLTDQYLKEGKYRSVPVFVFFDAQMRELGRFIERPARATAEMAATTAQLVADHPELPELRADYAQQSEQARALNSQAIRALRAARGAAWSNMLIEDIEAIIRGAQAGG